ncbi:hypothetical protein CCR75_006884 [Bremia lactucae]|uniref:Uncharacterized protein n=1 Tax=Bremia lactucae TaxID=4779 RepID=A0A976FJJ2_BRELC|nr:hypothetical protein CCR75_006884 [Bremia lactucae]
MKADRLENPNTMLHSKRLQSTRRGYSASETVTCASPNATHVRSRPRGTQATSVATSRQEADWALAQQEVRPEMQANYAKDRVAEADDQGFVPISKLHFGAFGDVRTMTLETVNFLIRVLEDRKQELLVENRNVRVKASYDVSNDEIDNLKEVEVALDAKEENM